MDEFFAVGAILLLSDRNQTIQKNNGTAGFPAKRLPTVPLRTDKQRRSSVHRPQM
jgi:hypothetical protein